MKSRDFCYWLQGYFELAGEGSTVTQEQVELIKKHLKMVFVTEIDPSFGGSATQGVLSALHGGKPDPLLGGAVMKC